LKTVAPFWAIQSPEVEDDEDDEDDDPEFFSVEFLLRRLEVPWSIAIAILLLASPDEMPRVFALGMPPP
jgi:hypothetical protein